MNKFFEKHELPKLPNDNLNRPVPIKEIKPILNIVQKNRPADADGFIAKFYQTLTKEIIWTLYNVLQNIEAEGTLPNSFYEANTIQVLKVNKDITRPIFL